MINLEKLPHWVVGLVLGYGIVILFVVGGIIGDVINSYIWMTIWGGIAEIGGFLVGAGVGIYMLIRGFRKVHVAEEELLSANALKEIIKERIVGKRLASYVIDISLVTVLNFVLSSILALLIAGRGDDPGESFSFLWIICGIMILPIYLTYCFGNGQTLGMSIMNLKLYGVDGRSPIGYKKGFIRWLGMLVSGLVLYLGFLWIVIDENYQGWHDKIAGTYVLNEGTTMEVPEEREKEKEEEPIKGHEEEMDKTIGIKVCSVLFVVGGLMQFVAMVTGSMLLGFVIFGSLLVGLAMFAAAYGIWNSKNWGRMLGIILGTLELVLGGVMGGILMSFPDILLGVSGFIILYFLLIDKNTKTLFRRW